jgi:heat shock protein HslJ
MTVARGVAAPFVVALAVALGLAGCSPTAEDTRSATAGLPDTLQQLTAHQWSLDRGDSSLATDDPAPVTLAFAEDRSVSGNAPCNPYRGTFSIDDDRLTIGDVSQTRRGCDPQTLAAEHEYLTTLQAVRDVDATDRDRLVLTGPGGARLAYDAYDLGRSIVGFWHVTNLARDSGIETALVGTDPVLTFDADGALRAQSGCNTLATSWALDGPDITIGPVAQTMMACDQPPGVMDQEAALGAALSAAARVDIVGDTLTLLDDDGAILVVADRQPSSG